MTTIESVAQARQKISNKIQRELTVMDIVREDVGEMYPDQTTEQDFAMTLAIYRGIRSTATRYLRTGQHAEAAAAKDDD